MVKDGKKAPKGDAENIKVAVRVRPLNTKEKDCGYKSIVDLDLATNQVKVMHMAGSPDVFTFDFVFNNNFSQEDIFIQTVLPLVESVMDGFNATIFAYGQSGSGKTYTMTGVLDDHGKRGVIPRSFGFIFGKISDFSKEGAGRGYRVMCSFMELYNGKCRDLLSKKAVAPLTVREAKDKTFYCEDLNVVEVKFEDELYRLMEEGLKKRQTAATELNADSSRSHSIFTVHTELTSTTEDGTTRVVTSKLNLVDLAGSERQTKTGAQGDTLKEGCNINLSLSALGSVIDTLVKGRGHVPFRSSPLTMLLKDSLGGGSKTVMFANINPSEHNVSETVSTLRFADRAKQIKNKPKIQMDPKDAKIAELEDRVKELTEKLKKYDSGEDAGLEKENEELKEKIEEMSTQLSGWEQENQRLNTDLKSQLAAKDKEIEDLNTKIEKHDEVMKQLEYEKELAQNTQKTDEARGTLVDFLNELAVIVAADGEKPEEAKTDMEEDAFNQYMENMKIKVKGGSGVNPAKLQEELSKQEQQYEKAAGDAKEKHQEEVQKLNTLNEQAQQALEQAMNRLQKIKAKADKEKEQKKAMEAKFEADKHEIIQTCEAEMASLKELSGELEGKVKDAQVELLQLREKEATWTSEKQEFSEKYDTKTKELDEELTKCKETLAETKKSLKTLKKTDDKLQEEYNDLKERYDKEKEESKATIQDLTEKISVRMAQSVNLSKSKRMDLTASQMGSFRGNPMDDDGDGVPMRRSSVRLSNSFRGNVGNVGKDRDVVVTKEVVEHTQEMQRLLEEVATTAGDNEHVATAVKQAAEHNQQADQLATELGALRAKFAEEKKSIMDKISNINKEAQENLKKTVETAQAEGVELSEQTTHAVQATLARDTVSATFVSVPTSGVATAAGERSVSIPGGDVKLLTPTKGSQQGEEADADADKEEEEGGGGTEEEEGEGGGGAGAGDGEGVVGEEGKEGEKKAAGGKGGAAKKKKKKSVQMSPKEDESAPPADTSQIPDDVPNTADAEMQQLLASDDINELRDALQAQHELEEVLREELQETGQQIENLTQDLEDAKKAVETKGEKCDEEIAILRLKLEECKDQMQSKIDTQEEMLDKLEEEKELLQKTSTQAVHELEAIQKKMAEQHEQFAEKEKVALDANTEVIRMKADLEVKQRENALFTKDIETLNSHLEQQRQKMEREKKEWMEEREQLEKDLESARAEMQQENEKATSVQQDHVRAQREIDRLKQDMTALKEDKEQLVNDAIQAKAAKKEAESERDKATWNLDRLENKVKEKSAALENNKTILDTQAALLEKKKKKEQQLQQELESRKQQYAELEAASSEHLNGEIQRLTGMHNQRIKTLVEENQKVLKEARRDWHKEREKLQKKNQKLQLSVGKVKQRYDEEVVNNHELEAKMEDIKMKEMEKERAGGSDMKVLENRHQDQISHMMMNARAARQQALLGIRQGGTGGGGAGGGLGEVQQLSHNAFGNGNNNGYHDTGGGSPTDPLLQAEQKKKKKGKKKKLKSENPYLSDAHSEEDDDLDYRAAHEPASMGLNVDMRSVSPKTTRFAQKRGLAGVRSASHASSAYDYE